MPIFRMKYWRINYFKEFLEMSDEDFETLKTRGRICVINQGGREVVDIDAIFLPPKYSIKMKKLIGRGSKKSS